jgi:hypothetical protein
MKLSKSLYSLPVEASRILSVVPAIQTLIAGPASAAVQKAVASVQQTKSITAYVRRAMTRPSWVCGAARRRDAGLTPHLDWCIECATKRPGRIAGFRAMMGHRSSERRAHDRARRALSTTRTTEGVRFQPPGGR